jgi:hypothetical protein
MDTLRQYGLGRQRSENNRRVPRDKVPTHTSSPDSSLLLSPVSTEKRFLGISAAVFCLFTKRRAGGARDQPKRIPPLLVYGNSESSIGG